MPAPIGEYKGHKTISLSDKPDDRFPFTFGGKKARLILAHLENIKAFVEVQDNEKED